MFFHIGLDLTRAELWIKKGLKLLSGNNAGKRFAWVNFQKNNDLHPYDGSKKFWIARGYALVYPWINKDIGSRKFWSNLLIIVDPNIGPCSVSISLVWTFDGSISGWKGISGRSGRWCTVVPVAEFWIINSVWFGNSWSDNTPRSIRRNW